jgi:hypothetical protein
MEQLEKLKANRNYYDAIKGSAKTVTLSKKKIASARERSIREFEHIQQEESSRQAAAREASEHIFITF